MIFFEGINYSQCYYKNKVFKSKERFEYVVTYKLGFITINAGYVTFSVDCIIINNIPYYKYESTGSSNPSYDWIFKVRENYVAYSHCNPLIPVYYKRNSIEGSYFAKEEYKFIHNKNKVYSIIHNSNKKLTYDTITLHKCGYDLLTAIYAFRNISFDSLKENQIIPITVIIDNKWENLYVRFLRKEQIKVKEKEYSTYHLKVKVVEGTIFKGGEAADVYVLTNNQRIPIYVEAEILVGKVILYFQNYYSP
ncbi:MAG: DUF3108 domain-containing protein [Bacteroidales bacterium]|nr:DUF3108 domain-containing protein [Bacteroidales bacterium]